MTTKLYKHQLKQNKKVVKALKTHNHILYGACTGFGKSRCLEALIDNDLNNGLSVLVLAPYRKLIFQLEFTFANYKPHVVMGSIDRGDIESGVLLSSMDTMNSRLKANSLYFENIDKIYIDEAHISCNFPPNKSSRMYLLYTKYWYIVKWVGFTATPIKANGYRLEGWDKVIYKYQTPDLIRMGYLANFNYYAPVDIDLSNMKTNTIGEYIAEDVEDVTNTPTAISSIKKLWRKHGKNKKKVLIFASSIKHAELLQKAIPGGFVIHSNMSDSKQMGILQIFKSSKVGTLINVGMLTTGYDDPTVDMLIIGKPIKSERLFIQVVGRALRLYGSKVATIFDMCSCYVNCGLPSDIRDFNKVKTKINDTEQVVLDNVMRCGLCGEVSPRCEFSLKRKTTKKYIITKYTCPSCNKVCKIIRQDLTKVKEIKEVKIVKVKKLSYKKRKKIVGKFITEFTKAKVTWSHFIVAAINKSDKGSLFDQIIAKDITNKTKWKNILTLYGDVKNEK